MTGDVGTDYKRESEVWDGVTKIHQGVMGALILALFVMAMVAAGSVGIELRECRINAEAQR